MPYKDPAKQREAVRESVAKWRGLNPEKYRARSRQAGKKRYMERSALFAKLKSVPCMDCGQRFPPCVMDFDHRDPTTKITEVATLIMGNLAHLLQEIDKCDIVCANCHRIRTFVRKV